MLLSTRQLHSPAVSSFHSFSGENSTLCVCVMMWYFAFPHISLSYCIPFLSFPLSFCCHFFHFSTSVNASYLCCTRGGFVTFGIHCFILRCLCDTSISWRSEVPKNDTHVTAADPSHHYCYCFNKKLESFPGTVLP